MNKKQREVIGGFQEQLRTIGEAIAVEMETEQEKLDNMPENLQGTERYEKMEEGITRTGVLTHSEILAQVKVRSSTKECSPSFIALSMEYGHRSGVEIYIPDIQCQQFSHAHAGIYQKENN